MTQEIGRRQNHDARERASEILGRIVTASDMTEMTPLQFSLAEYEVAARR